MFAALKTPMLASVGKLQLPGGRKCEARNMDDLPGMSVGIGKIAGIATPTGLLCGLEQPRPGRPRAHEGCVDLGARPAIPRQCGSTEPGRERNRLKGSVLGKLIPAIEGKHHAAGIEEGNLIAGRAEFARKSERLVEAHAGMEVAHAQRDGSK